MVPIAVPSLQRSAALPAVPTFKESVFDGVALDSWVGFFVPANTPTDIIAKLNVATNKVLRDPQVEARLLAAGIVAANQTP